MLATVLVVEPGNSAAVAATISKSPDGSLHTSIYYTFNSATSSTMAQTQDYLNQILSHLRTSPSATRLSLADKSAVECIKTLLHIVHMHCWGSFQKRVNKRLGLLSQARDIIASADAETLVLEDRQVYNEILDVIDIVVDIARVHEGTSPATLHDDDVDNLIGVYERLTSLNALSPEGDAQQRLDELDVVLGASISLP